MDSRDIEKWRVELDSYAHVEDGVEYWLARDLMEPLGYAQWRNFGLIGQNVCPDRTSVSIH